MVDNGLSFHSTANIVREQYEISYWRVRSRYEEEISTTHRSSNPGQCFPPYSLLFDQAFYDDMISRTSMWLACDHTFKSAANIGFTRESDGRWIKAMKCLLFWTLWGR